MLVSCKGRSWLCRADSGYQSAACANLLCCLACMDQRLMLEIQHTQDALFLPHSMMPFHRDSIRAERLLRGFALGALRGFSRGAFSPSCRGPGRSVAVANR